MPLYTETGVHMAVSNPDKSTHVVFALDDARYETTAKRGQIVHEVFPRTLPEHVSVGHRMTFRAPNGDELFADNFIGDIEDTYGEVVLTTAAQPILGSSGPWTTIAFDHLAITVADRAGARDFFRDVVQMQVMRDDPHLTVIATGSTALFLFDAGVDAPLSTARPSSWHHIGFVVDNLEHAYAHLRQHQDRIASDFTLLERDERWSLYFFYRNGDVTFMIQFSEIKAAERGFPSGPKRDFAGYLYDYTSRPYGLVFGEKDIQ